MPINDPSNLVKNTILSPAEEAAQERDLTLSNSALQTFVINDVVLEIPPTSISIQNEDLVWSWKTLRTKSSTKIASGRGMCQVTLNVVFTPSLILNLHRLIVQFRHSPFCWVQNRLLRETLASHWPAFKQMAFTMTGLHVSSLTGHPGSFNVQIDLRWFNYAPYGDNFLFRREWRTRPIVDTPTHSTEQTIPRYESNQAGENAVLERVPNVFTVPEPGSVRPWSPISFDNEIHGGYTLQQLKETHMGEVFDLLPLPSRMKPSQPVGSPAQSNIYVRYINTIQQEALLNNFGIDVHKDMLDPSLYTAEDIASRNSEEFGAFDPEDTTNPLHPWNAVTVGENSGGGLVRSLCHGVIPSKMKGKWINTILRYGKTTSISWEEYLSLDLGREIQQKLLDFYRDLTQNRRAELKEAAVAALGQATFEDTTDPDLNAWPVDTSIGINSDYGMRFHPIHKEERMHKGVDMPTATGSDAYAISDGVVHWTGDGGGYGKMVILRHPDANGPIMTRYAHLDDNTVVSAGDTVTTGQVVGKTGATGSVTGPHLHFEVFVYSEDTDRWIDTDPNDWIHRTKRLILPTSPESMTTPQPTPETTSPAEIPDELPEEETEDEVQEVVTEALRGEAPGLSEEQYRIYGSVLTELWKRGYVAYEGDSSVTNVYRRVQQMLLASVNSDPEFMDYDPNNLGGRGIFIQHDAVVTSVSGSLGHIVASIPIIGHEYPTHQHLGSIEPTYGIEFMSIDPALEGLSTTGQMLHGVRTKLQENARQVRLIPDSSCLSVDCLMTRLLGTSMGTDVIYDGEDETTSLMKKFIISRSNTQTIEGSPGTTAIYWDLQETNPNQEEYIVPSDEFGEREDPEEKIREIIQKLEAAGTSDNLDSNASKQILLGLGQEIGGIDALRDIDPGAADYFESIPSDSDGRTFVVYESDPTYTFNQGHLEDVNSQMATQCTISSPRPSNTGSSNVIPYRTGEDKYLLTTDADTYSRYEQWAEQNGILAGRIDTFGGDGAGTIINTNAGGTGAAGLNLQDLTDLSMLLFDSPSYQGYLDERGIGDWAAGVTGIEALEGSIDSAGYGTSQLGGEGGDPEVRQAYDEYAVEASRFRQKVYVVETTNYSAAVGSSDVNDKVDNYSRMLSFIKVTAELILAEEAVNGFSAANNIPEPEGGMAVSKSEIQSRLYDLDIKPSMWSAYLYGLSQNLEREFFGIMGLLGWDDFIDNVTFGDPGFDLNSHNPDLKNWIDVKTITARAILGGMAGDLGSSLIGNGVIMGLWTLGKDVVQGVTGYGTEEVGGRMAAVYRNHIEYITDNFETEIQGAASGYTNKVFPLTGGIWQQNVVESYFTGMASKLGVQYVTSRDAIGGSFETLGYSEGNESFGLTTFFGGFENWLKCSMHGMKYWQETVGPITRGFSAYFKEYYYAASARSAGIVLPNMDRVLVDQEVEGGIYLWEDNAPTRNRYPPIFTNRLSEEVKINHIKGLLKGLGQLILGEPEVLEFLGVHWSAPGDSNSENPSGVECYPDLNLPEHPYYGNSLYAMNPDFYYWNIYDDATGTLSKEILERAEEALQRAVEGPYEALKSMQQDGMDPSEFADAYGYLDVGGSSLRPAQTRLVSHWEGSDEVDMGWYPEDHANRVWINTGPTHQNIAATNVFLDSGELSPEYVSYLDFGRLDGKGDIWYDELQAEVDNITDEEAKERAQESLDELKEYSKTRQMFPPLLSHWHGNPNYKPTGDELEYYKDLNLKIRETEVFFGSRLGYVGGHATAIEDASDGLTDTRLASMSEYKMTFDPDSLKRLAVDSSKDILSQKYTMRRAFPTFKLYFVEEDEIYNRVLSFDDFYAYNGVKEFTVHQSRKNPADTATIVLQNVAGTLDGTKRKVITDLDYFKQDESGNFINPHADLTSETLAGSNADGENALTEQEDNALITSPSWLDNKSQPFGAVVLRPGMNVQLRAGYSNDPGMLNVLISGRVVDVQWSTNGDLVEIVVQSFGTELVKYMKGRQGENSPVVYPTTHQLLGSLMLSPELKHFGRWTTSGIFQPGESKDSTVDFANYSEKSFMSNFKTTNSVLRWMYQNPLPTSIGFSALYIASLFPWGRGAGVAGRSLIGKLGGMFTRVAGTGRVATAVGSGSRWIYTRVLGRRAANVLGSQGALGSTKAYIETVKAAGRAGTIGTLRLTPETLASSGAFSGIVGRWFMRSYHKTSQALLGAVQLGDDAAIAALSNKLIAIESRAIASRAILLQLGAASSSTEIMTLSAGPVVGRVLGGTLGTVWGSFVNTARLAAVTMGTLGASEVSTRKLTNSIYDSTIGAYKRSYALTKARLYLSPQDDNLYPPSPKDYMHLDYVSIWDDFAEWSKRIGKKFVFGLGQNLLYAAGILEEGGAWAEDQRLADWYEFWKGGEQPPHVLEKRINPTQCEYNLNNTTIWDVFHEMSLRHPGWVYGARPYGTRFRYTMFFGVPSQRYWAKPASNNFIHRITKLRKYIGVGISEQNYKLLYGEGALEDLKEDLRTKLITVDDPTTYFANDAGETFETYDEAELDAFNQYDSSTLNMYGRWDDDGDGSDDYLGRVGQIEDQAVDPFLEPYGLVETTLGDRSLVPEEIYKEHLKLAMTNRALEEYLLGLEQRFVPFRRYHYLTSDADIVHNGIIASNRGVANAVSVLYREPDSTPEDSRPGGVVEMKANTQIPESEINMANVSFPNCKGYTMGLRYGLGSLLHSMREMYKGEMLVLGNPRIRPWDICIVRDEYNDMIGPVEVEAVVHMFSHETGFLTEIKPNAVVMANEISSYPILNALQLMCMAVEDNRNGKTAISNDMTEEERSMYVNDSWSEELQLQYGSLMGKDGFNLNELFPQWDIADMQQAVAGVDQAGFNDLEDTKDHVANIMGYGGFGTALMGSAYMMSKGFYPKTRGGWVVAGLSTIAGAAATITATEAVKSTSLQWFIAAPILFAKCLEEETISIMPLTKNGIPIVPSISLKDPATMWRSIFGRLYNYAQDTATGLQDMAWYWEMNSDNWWETWVNFSSDQGYSAYREDFRNAAGGG